MTIRPGFFLSLLPDVRFAFLHPRILFVIIVNPFFFSYCESASQSAKSLALFFRHLCIEYELCFHGTHISLCTDSVYINI